MSYYTSNINGSPSFDMTRPSILIKESPTNAPLEFPNYYRNITKIEDPIISMSKISNINTNECFVVYGHPERSPGTFYTYDKNSTSVLVLTNEFYRYLTDPGASPPNLVLNCGIIPTLTTVNNLMDDIRQGLVRETNARGNLAIIVADLNRLYMFSTLPGGKHPKGLLEELIAICDNVNVIMQNPDVVLLGLDSEIFKAYVAEANNYLESVSGDSSDAIISAVTLADDISTLIKNISTLVAQIEVRGGKQQIMTIYDEVKVDMALIVEELQKPYGPKVEQILDNIYQRTDNSDSVEQVYLSTCWYPTSPPWIRTIELLYKVKIHFKSYWYLAPFLFHRPLKGTPSNYLIESVKNLTKILSSDSGWLLCAIYAKILWSDNFSLLHDANNIIKNSKVYNAQLHMQYFSAVYDKILATPGIVTIENYLWKLLYTLFEGTYGTSYSGETFQFTLSNIEPSHLLNINYVRSNVFRTQPAKSPPNIRTLTLESIKKILDPKKIPESQIKYFCRNPFEMLREDHFIILPNAIELFNYLMTKANLSQKVEISLRYPIVAMRVGTTALGTSTLTKFCDFPGKIFGCNTLLDPEGKIKIPSDLFTFSWDLHMKCFRELYLGMYPAITTYSPAVTWWKSFYRKIIIGSVPMNISSIFPDDITTIINEEIAKYGRHFLLKSTNQYIQNGVAHYNIVMYPQTIENAMFTNNYSLIINAITFQENESIWYPGETDMPILIRKDISLFFALCILLTEKQWISVGEPISTNVLFALDLVIRQTENALGLRLLQEIPAWCVFVGLPVTDLRAMVEAVPTASNAKIFLESEPIQEVFVKDTIYYNSISEVDSYSPNATEAFAYGLQNETILNLTYIAKPMPWNGYRWSEAVSQTVTVTQSGQILDGKFPQIDTQLIQPDPNVRISLTTTCPALIISDTIPGSAYKSSAQTISCNGYLVTPGNWTKNIGYSNATGLIWDVGYLKYSDGKLVRISSYQQVYNLQEDSGKILVPKILGVQWVDVYVNTVFLKSGDIDFVNVESDNVVTIVIRTERRGKIILIADKLSGTDCSGAQTIIYSRPPNITLPVATIPDSSRNFVVTNSNGSQVIEPWYLKAEGTYITPGVIGPSDTINNCSNILEPNAHIKYSILINDTVICTMHEGFSFKDQLILPPGTLDSSYKVTVYNKGIEMTVDKNNNLGTRTVPYPKSILPLSSFNVGMITGDYVAIAWRKNNVYDGDEIWNVTRGIYNNGLIVPINGFPIRISNTKASVLPGGDVLIGGISIYRNNTETIYTADNEFPSPFLIYLKITDNEGKELLNENTKQISYLRSPVITGENQISTISYGSSIWFLASLNSFEVSTYLTKLFHGDYGMIDTKIFTSTPSSDASLLRRQLLFDGYSLSWAAFAIKYGISVEERNYLFAFDIVEAIQPLLTSNFTLLGPKTILELAIEWGAVKIFNAVLPYINMNQEEMNKFIRSAATGLVTTLTENSNTFSIATLNEMTDRYANYGPTIEDTNLSAGPGKVIEFTSSNTSVPTLYSLNSQTLGTCRIIPTTTPVMHTFLSKPILSLIGTTSNGTGTGIGMQTYTNTSTGLYSTSNQVNILGSGPSGLDPFPLPIMTHGMVKISFNVDFFSMISLNFNNLLFIVIYLSSITIKLSGGASIKEDVPGYMTSYSVELLLFLQDSKLLLSLSLNGGYNFIHIFDVTEDIFTNNAYLYIGSSTDNTNPYVIVTSLIGTYGKMDGVPLFAFKDPLPYRNMGYDSHAAYFWFKQYKQNCLVRCPMSINDGSKCKGITDTGYPPEGASHEEFFSCWDGAGLIKPWIIQGSARDHDIFLHEIDGGKSKIPTGALYRSLFNCAGYWFMSYQRHGGKILIDSTNGLPIYNLAASPLSPEISDDGYLIPIAMRPMELLFLPHQIGATKTGSKTVSAYDELLHVLEGVQYMTTPGLTIRSGKTNNDTFNLAKLCTWQIYCSGLVTGSYSKNNNYYVNNYQACINDVVLRTCSNPETYSSVLSNAQILTPYEQLFYTLPNEFDDNQVAIIKGGTLGELSGLSHGDILYLEATKPLNATTSAVESRFQLSFCDTPFSMIFKSFKTTNTSSTYLIYGDNGWFDENTTMLACETPGTNQWAINAHNIVLFSSNNKTGLYSWPLEIDGVSYITHPTSTTTNDIAITCGDSSSLIYSTLVTPNQTASPAPLGSYVSAMVPEIKSDNKANYTSIMSNSETGQSNYVVISKVTESGLNSNIAIRDQNNSLIFIGNVNATSNFPLTFPHIIAGGLSKVTAYTIPGSRTATEAISPFTALRYFTPTGSLADMCNSIEHRHGIWCETDEELVGFQQFNTNVNISVNNQDYIIDFKDGPPIPPKRWAVITYDLYGIPDETIDTERSPLAALKNSEDTLYVGTNDDRETLTWITVGSIDLKTKFTPVSLWFKENLISPEIQPRISYPPYTMTGNTSNYVSNDVTVSDVYNRSSNINFWQGSTASYLRDESGELINKLPQTEISFTESAGEFIPTWTGDAKSLKANPKLVSCMNRIISYDPRTKCVQLELPIPAAYNVITSVSSGIITIEERVRYVDQIHVSKLLRLSSTVGRHYGSITGMSMHVSEGERRIDIVDPPIQQNARLGPQFNSRPGCGISVTPRREHITNQSGNLVSMKENSTLRKGDLFKFNKNTIITKLSILDSYVSSEPETWSPIPTLYKKHGYYYTLITPTTRRIVSERAVDNNDDTRSYIIVGSSSGIEIQKRGISPPTNEKSSDIWDPTCVSIDSLIIGTVYLAIKSFSTTITAGNCYKIHIHQILSNENFKEFQPNKCFKADDGVIFRPVNIYSNVNAAVTFSRTTLKPIQMCGPLGNPACHWTELVGPGCAFGHPYFSMANIRYCCPDTVLAPRTSKFVKEILVPQIAWDAQVVSAVIRSSYVEFEALVRGNESSFMSRFVGPGRLVAFPTSLKQKIEMGQNTYTINSTVEANFTSSSPSIDLPQVLTGEVYIWKGIVVNLSAGLYLCFVDNNNNCVRTIGIYGQYPSDSFNNSNSNTINVPVSILFNGVYGYLNISASMTNENVFLPMNNVNLMFKVDLSGNNAKITITNGSEIMLYCTDSKDVWLGIFSGNCTMKFTNILAPVSLTSISQETQSSISKCNQITELRELLLDHNNPFWTWCYTMITALLMLDETDPGADLRKVQLLQIFALYCEIANIPVAEISYFLSVAAAINVPKSLLAIQAPAGFEIAKFDKSVTVAGQTSTNHDYDKLSVSILATMERIAIAQALDTIDDIDLGINFGTGDPLGPVFEGTIEYTPYAYQACQGGAPASTFANGQISQNTNYVIPIIEASETKMVFEEIATLQKYMIGVLGRCAMRLSVGGVVSSSIDEFNTKISYTCRPRRKNERIWDFECNDGNLAYLGSESCGYVADKRYVPIQYVVNETKITKLYSDALTTGLVYGYSQIYFDNHTNTLLLKVDDVQINSSTLGSSILSIDGNCIYLSDGTMVNLLSLLRTEHLNVYDPMITTIELFDIYLGKNGLHFCKVGGTRILATWSPFNLAPLASVIPCFGSMKGPLCSIDDITEALLRYPNFTAQWSQRLNVNLPTKIDIKLFP